MERYRHLRTKQPWNLADAMQDSENATAAKVFQQKISTALTALDDEDNRAAAALGEAFREIGSLLGNQPDRLDRTVVDILDGGRHSPGTPTELHRLWESLTPNEKDALARWDPSIGSRDGLPALDRDYYNRRYLSALEQLPDRTVAAGYTTVRGELRPDTFLLSVTDGHAVVAVGNPDAAGNVATLVPGTGSGLSGVGGDLQRTKAMYDASVRASTDGSHISDPVVRIRRSPRHSRRSIGSVRHLRSAEARQLPGRVTNLA